MIRRAIGRKENGWEKVFKQQHRQGDIDKGQLERVTFDLYTTL